MVKWVWDIDERICVNASAIKYFEIIEQISGHILYARLEKESITIAESSDLGILKDKIRTIIAGDYMVYNCLY